MTPSDIPGRLEIHGLFPWLAHLAPAENPSEPAPAPIRTTPEASATESAPVDLPRAA
jgi:hypothetical protein